jgi:peptide methionine sulfoxide reductase msrA/msrB
MTKEIYFAAGCFWGAEKYLKLVEGVEATEVGFANGHTEHPSYKEVYTDTTGHAETVRVVYDPQRVSLPFLVDLFFRAIDPTSLNRQGEDVGTRYRTGVYFADAAEEAPIREVFATWQERVDAPLAVELEPLRCFYAAEEYHQNYLDKNPGGYCHLSPALFELARTARMKEA